jgi:hypothetical protein
MIYVLFDESPDGGGRLRIVSDEPDSFTHRHVELSFSAYVSPDKRAFDGKAQTWLVRPDARHDFARWMAYAAVVCGAYCNLEPVEPLSAEPEHAPEPVEWSDFL